MTDDALEIAQIVLKRGAGQGNYDSRLPTTEQAAYLLAQAVMKLTEDLKSLDALNAIYDNGLRDYRELSLRQSEALRDATRIIDSYCCSEIRYGAKEWLEKYGEEK